MKSNCTFIFLVQYIQSTDQHVNTGNKKQSRQEAWCVPLGNTIKLDQVVKFRQILTHTVVTQAAMGGPRWAERFTSEAVFELYHLLVDEDLLGSRRGAIR